jgi:putative phage-type endonuclease
MLPNEGKRFRVLRYSGSDEDRHDHWLRFRNEGVGGSDVAGIMGLSNWTSPISIWNQKTGRVEPEDISGKEVVEWGTRLEPLIREKFKSMHPEMRVLHPDCTLISIDRPWAHANLDGFVRDPEMGWGVLEIKTAQYDSGWFDEQGNETVPLYYQTQAIHYLSVTGYKFVRFAVLIRGCIYIERLFIPDEEDMQMVVDSVDEFWHEFVEKDVPPTLIVGSPDESRSLYGMYVDHDSEYEDVSGIEEWEQRLLDYDLEAQREKDAKAQRALLGNEIKARVGDGLGLRTGSYEVKWVRSEKRDSGLRIKQIA